ncbi:type II toxin-antitoxin system HipA family toxin [Thiothrix subterranea]|uniref:HipA domain-containing protein n=1 Tax=Thiothrix subterranea TaxID=2735563 RepID=UPI00192C71B7|nr:HipA domain-containing protein [Thiothrix subterranea]QQZ28677.1 type II toxin-antitoxin system HipA family toxin [Thiothrix subterranea]
MTGYEHRLQICLGEQLIGFLQTDAQGQLTLAYTAAWQASGFAISPHLPLTSVASHPTVQRFLRNLLPEGQGFDILLEHQQLSRANTFGIIRALGADTPGALQFLPENAPSTPTSLRRIAPTELQERLNNLPTRNLIVWDGKPRLSVAGVQHKINVLADTQGELAFGEGKLCSTHILKFEPANQNHVVLNEYLLMQLAKAVGLNVAEVELRRFGQHRALLVTRFDRKRQGDTVLRRHLLDGCQVLDLPPEYKYERNFGNSRDVANIREGASLPRLFVFCDQCRSPALARKTLLDWVLFNLIISNWDAHGKNISFFVGKQGIEPAPYYDLVNIAVYPDYQQELAMALGDDFDTHISAFQLADFAESCGLSRPLVQATLTALCKQVVEQLPFVCAKETWHTTAEQQFAAALQHSIRQQVARLLEQAGMMHEVTL